MRKWVRMALRYDGWNVNMVGSKNDGTDFTDNVGILSGATLSKF